jgi:uncharacterized protein (TIGR02246 family)
MLGTRAEAGISGGIMRKASILSIMKASILSIMIVALSAPAFADDADLKKQVEQINTAYMESFNKQDAAGIAALFATGGIFVNQFGPRTDMAQVVEGTFKAGFNHAETQVDQVWPLGSETALGMGQIRFTGKNQSGASIETAAFWTATYVREGGKWKIRMLSGIPKPPPPAK